MDFANSQAGTARIEESRRKRWKSPELPSGLLAGLREELIRLEPEFCRLVQLYDEVAAFHPEQDRSSLSSASLLNEAWCEQLGVPSEVDIRAAAVRLFAAEGRAPAWLRRRIATAAARPRNGDPVDRNSNGARHPATRVETCQQELVRQYIRAVEACQQLLDLVARVEKSLDRISNLSARSAEQERLKVETGVGLEDVTAAATRMRMREPQPSSG